MEILNKFFSREKQKERENNKEVISIVDNDVEKGTFSELAEQLDGLSDISNSREKFIFERNSSSIYGWSIIICVIFFIADLRYIPIFVGTLLYSDGFETTAVSGIAIILAIMVFNIVLVVNIVSRIRFNRRYDTYVKDLRFKNIEVIDDLAAYSKVEPEKVIKDLKRAIKLKLIPQGHFGCGNLIFIISNEVYDKYKGKQAVYDQYYRKQIEERLAMKECTK